MAEILSVSSGVAFALKRNCSYYRVQTVQKIIVTNAFLIDVHILQNRHLGRGYVNSIVFSKANKTLDVMKLYECVPDFIMILALNFFKIVLFSYFS